MKDNFKSTIHKIVENDPRYSVEAYEFISEAVNYTARKLNRRTRDSNPHINGKELLEGIRDFAIEQFGPMAGLVLKNWGLFTSEDIGNVVFKMVNEKLLRADERDSIDDFKDIFDFKEALSSPFIPTKPAVDNPPIIA